MPWRSMGAIYVDSIARLFGLQPHMCTRSPDMLLLNSQCPRVLVSKTEMVKRTTAQSCEEYLKLYLLAAQDTATMSNHKQRVLKYYTYVMNG